jgi:hypothetical protein
MTAFTLRLTIGFGWRKPPTLRLQPATDPVSVADQERGGESILFRRKSIHYPLLITAFPCPVLVKS